MDSFLYMPVSEHTKLTASFLKYTKRTRDIHTAESSSSEKRSKLRKTAWRFSVQLRMNSPLRS